MKKKQSGFIALIATVVISSMLVATAFTLSMTSFFARSTLLESEYKERSIALAEACVDTALLKRANDSSYSGSETIPVGTDSCSIFPIVSVSGQITIKTKAIFRNSVTNMQVVANDSDLSIASWGEVPTL